jgi:hypothetical protein
MSTSWRQLQQRHLNNEGRQHSSKQWAQKLFVKLHNLAWSLWKHRNDVKHKTDRRRHIRMERQLNHEIHRLNIHAANRLAPRERHHFRLPLPVLLNKNLAFKQNWFRNANSAIVRADRRRERNLLANNTSQEQAAILEWLRTGRPS